MGSRAAALARLDRHFQQLNAVPCSEFAFMGNEVSLKTPWMYAFAGEPWKTQEVVRRVLAELYSNTPGGMPGNDDGGVLSAWYVLSSIGLYPQISGVGGLVVSTGIPSRLRRPQEWSFHRNLGPRCFRRKPIRAKSQDQRAGLQQLVDPLEHAFRRRDARLRIDRQAQ
jgi:hypothetical protein